MCQGCEDFREFEAAVDAYVAAELPKMIAQNQDMYALFERLYGIDFKPPATK